MMAEAINNIIFRDMTASDLDRASDLEKEALANLPGPRPSWRMPWNVMIQPT